MDVAMHGRLFLQNQILAKAGCSFPSGPEGLAGKGNGVIYITAETLPQGIRVHVVQ